MWDWGYYHNIQGTRVYVRTPELGVGYTIWKERSRWILQLVSMAGNKLQPNGIYQEKFATLKLAKEFGESHYNWAKKGSATPEELVDDLVNGINKSGI